MSDAFSPRQELTTILPELRAYARFLRRDHSAADDLVHDSVVRALAALDQFQSGTSFKAWIFAIARNVFLEQTRRRKREDAAMLAHAHTHPPGLQSHGGDVTDVEQMLWRLPPLLREALVLVAARGLTHEEAAAVCAVPVGTMRARVSRARARLAKALGDAGVAWDG
jgi:RNA polymerase sigma-70 factor (ECF subfamily)